MIIYKTLSSPTETGTPYEPIDRATLNPTQQRSFLKQAMVPMSGIILHFDRQDIAKLQNTNLLTDIDPKNIKPGSGDSANTDFSQADSMDTQARNFFNPRATEPDSKNKLGILLKVSNKEAGNLSEIRVDPDLFEKTIEESILDPMTAEDVNL